MESRDLDRIARRIAMGLDRRKLLRGVMGGGLAAVGLTRTVHAQSDAQTYEPGWYDAYEDGCLYYYDGEKYTGEQDCSGKNNDSGEEAPAGWYPSEDGCSYYWDGTQYSGEKECVEEEPAAESDAGTNDQCPEYFTSLAIAPCVRDQRTCTDDQWIRGGDLRSCDHRDRDFSGVDLSGADLTDAVLLGATFTGSMLTGADLTHANLRRVTFANATLTNAVLTSALLELADLSNADLTGTNLFDADLRNADLTGVVWSDTTCPDGSRSGDHGGTCCGYLGGALAAGCDDASAVLLESETQSGSTDVASSTCGPLYLQDETGGCDRDQTTCKAETKRGGDLSNCSLNGADLRYEDLSGANLTGAILSNADLSNADLTGANLTGADLKDANLYGANLTDADLTDTDLTSVDWDNITCPDGTNSDKNITCSGEPGWYDDEDFTYSCCGHLNRAKLAAGC